MKMNISRPMRYEYHYQTPYQYEYDSMRCTFTSSITVTVSVGYAYADDHDIIKFNESLIILNWVKVNHIQFYINLNYSLLAL